VDEVLARRAHEPWYAGAVAALPGRLAALVAPVLLVAGEYDIWPTCTAVRELAALFGNAAVALRPGTGHFPWVDDAASFAATVHEFLAPSGTARRVTPRCYPGLHGCTGSAPARGGV
jgi:pimeloyl-ACP methyl ester carboxylesterase